MTRIAPYVIAALALGLSAFTNPYDPVQRGLGGGVLGAALVLPLEPRRVAGREPPSEQRSVGQPAFSEESLLHLHPHRAPITATQPTDIPLTDFRATRSRAMDTQAIRDTRPTSVLRVMDTQATRGSPLTPDPHPMETRADRSTLPIPVPVMDIPCLAIPVIALRRIGRLEPITSSSHLAEFRPQKREDRPRGSVFSNTNDLAAYPQDR
jgi:hypothetical protein